MHKDGKKFTGRTESKFALGLVREKESKVVQILNCDMRLELYLWSNSVCYVLL